MKSEKINNMFQKHLQPEESLLYADFLNDLCKLIVSNSYFEQGEREREREREREQSF